MKRRVTTYGPGGFDPQQPNANVVSDTTVTSPGLGADRLTLPADGVTVATLHYMALVASETTASWVINGLAYSEPLVNGESTITLTASIAGTVEVSCNGVEITLQAV